MIDNVIECRKKLYNIWFNTYKENYKEEPGKDLCDIINFILNKNIICGNTLSMKQVNEKAEDIDLPIIISKWSFIKDNQIENKDYKFEDLFFNKDLQFDIIIGNPPYQLNDTSLSASASPLYHLFIEQGIKLEPKYLIMIIPSRWMTGGKGLEKFRKQMLEDKHITELHDFIHSEDCFNDVEIKGGVCYFLRERDKEDKCLVITHNKTNIKHSKRYLKEDCLNIFIRQSELIEIKEKVWKNKKQKSFIEIVSTRQPYGLPSDFFNPTIQKQVNNIKQKVNITTEEKYGLKTPSEIPYKDGYEIIGLKNNKRIWKYVDKDYKFPKDKGLGKWKVFIPESYGIGILGEMPSLPIIAKPNQVCTETFIELGPVNTKLEAENILKYLKTKFFRCLVSIYKQTQHASSKVYTLVPMQDFTNKSDINWDNSIENINEQLYKKYNFSKQEIDFIENNIKDI